MADLAPLVSEALSESIADSLLSRLDDFVAVIIERKPTPFLKAHHVAVDGAEQSLIAFEFDWAAFDAALDAELGAALRARDFESPGSGTHLTVAPNEAPALTTESESGTK